MDSVAEGRYCLTVRHLIRIRGNVQGVGFRPTVYRYAAANGLTGYVLNSSSGVTIEVQGSHDNLDSFISQLRDQPPAAARIDSFDIENIDDVPEDEEFTIRFSHDSGETKTAGISPDLATCPDCVSDIFDRENRRYGYPFTNCTNCGPRFTIIEDRPYDRAYTTMKEFEMCPSCKKEYNDPLNRRFHAQPNACPQCGPKLKLVSKGNTTEETDPALEQCIAFLKEGALGAIKGLGGFHFACDPLNQESLNKLRTFKNRPNKAFALMMRDLETVEPYCHVSREEAEALQSSEAPIVLLRKKNKLLDAVSPDNNYLGVMLPFTPLHHLIMDKIPLLIMTSANRRDEPLAVKDEEIQTFLDEGFLDFYLTNNRSIAHRCDDSIIQFRGSRKQLIRRSRGFVPNPLFLKSRSDRTLLASGANMKNTFSLLSGDKIFLSQHIGDLMDYRNLEYQNDQIADFKGLLDVQTETLVTDAHPGYENYDINAQKVYHHHAHMLSVMAEEGLEKGPLTAVICDGTGFGTDESIWGFEFLSIDDDMKTFQREAYLDNFLLPGGEQAIREIDRIAISLAFENENLPFPAERISAIGELIASGINSPSTSSLGRLFDGVTALCGLADRVEYEARGAILLQREAELVEAEPKERYSTEIVFCCDHMTINYKILMKEILRDLEAGQPVPEIAWKFHRWVADSIISLLQHLEKTPVILSGGCFQNLLLSEMVEEELKEREYTYYMNRLVPPNDGGISLGQAYMYKE